MKKVKVSNGIYWLEFPEAELYILCGCPADTVKHLMKSGLILPAEKDGVPFETGPNCVLLSDALIQNGQFSNLSEFPVLQMLYRQGLILPCHPNNKGIKPLLIGRKKQIEAQKQYIFRGNYGLVSMDELRGTGMSEEEAREKMRIKLKFAFGKIRGPEELLDSLVVGDKFAEIRNEVFVRRSGFNKYSFKYKDQIADIDLNLAPGEMYESPYHLGFHKTPRNYFSVIHCGEGDGWNINQPCMSSIITINGKIYLIDAGPNILHSLLALGIDPSEIEGIFHTHAHDDHFAGIPSLFIGGNLLKYFATSSVRASVTKKLCALMSISEDKFSDYFDFQDLEEGAWNKIGTLEVKPIYSPHPIENNIFIFRVLGEDGYHSYGHWADVTPFDVLDDMVCKEGSKDCVSQKSYDQFVADYLTPVDLKKVDVGGGMIHGRTQDFIEDGSGKIIWSHISAPLDDNQKAMGSSGGFGMIDVLISSDKDYRKVGARNFLEQYFPSAPAEEIEELLNCQFVSFNAGAVILKKGQAASHLYLVTAGTAQYIQPETNVSRSVSAGAVIGETSIINNKPLPGSYSAISCVEALQVPNAMFSTFVENNNLSENIFVRSKHRAVLRMSSLFGGGLSWPTQDKIAGTLEFKTYSAGEVILPLEKANKKLFLVREGEVELMFLGKIIQILGPGKVFGEEVLICGASNKFSVQSVQETKIAVVAYPDMLRIPIINWNLSTLLSKREKSAETLNLK